MPTQRNKPVRTKPKKKEKFEWSGSVAVKDKKGKQLETQHFEGGKRVSKDPAASIVKTGTKGEATGKKDWKKGFGGRLKEGFISGFEGPSGEEIKKGTLPITPLGSGVGAVKGGAGLLDEAVSTAKGGGSKLVGGYVHIDKWAAQQGLTPAQTKSLAKELGNRRVREAADLITKGDVNGVGKTILKVGAAALAVGSVVSGTLSLSAWAAVDNIISASSFQGKGYFNSLKEGRVSKGEAMAGIDALMGDVQYAQGFVNWETKVNPLHWGEFGKPLMVAANTGMIGLNQTRNDIEAFDVAAAEQERAFFQQNQEKALKGGTK